MVAAQMGYELTVRTKLGMDKIQTSKSDKSEVTAQIKNGADEIRGGDKDGVLGHD